MSTLLSLCPPPLRALPAPQPEFIEGEIVSAEIVSSEIVPADLGMIQIPPANVRADFPDIIALLLEDKRSPETRRAYEGDLCQFFDSQGKTAQSFLSQPTPQIALDLAAYKSQLRGADLAEATINRRLAAIKSLLKFAHRLGVCATDGRGLVDGEKVRHYRDTRGIELKQMRKLIQAPSKKFGDSLRGLRDTAILLLLCENALRRAEVCKLNESDFDFERRELSILGKGRGTQKEKVTVSENLAVCLRTYINNKDSKHTLLEENVSLEGKNSATVASIPLFESLDRRPEYAGARLSPDGLYQLIGFYGAQIGLKRLTPHQLRHSAITAALDATKGDVRKVQKLSRHLKIEVLMIYDDARTNMQGEVSGLLSKLLSK